MYGSNEAQLRREHALKRVAGGSIRWVNERLPAVHWLFRASDDTYVNVDNLAAYAAHFRPSLPFFLGDVHGTAEFPYADGGAGFLLSRAAMMAAADGLENYLRIGRGDTDDTSFGKFMYQEVGIRALQGSPFIGELYCLHADAAHLYAPRDMLNSAQPEDAAKAAGTWCPRAAIAAAASHNDDEEEASGRGPGADAELAMESVLLLPWPSATAADRRLWRGMGDVYGGCKKQTPTYTFELFWCGGQP